MMDHPLRVSRGVVAESAGARHYGANRRTIGARLPGAATVPVDMAQVTVKRMKT